MLLLALAGQVSFSTECPQTLMAAPRAEYVTSKWPSLNGASVLLLWEHVATGSGGL